MHVMTERTRLMSYLLDDLFNAILKKSTIKTPEVIFPLFVAHTKEVSVCQFFFQLLKIQLYFVICFVVFPTCSQLLLTTQKSRRTEKSFYNAQSLHTTYKPRVRSLQGNLRPRPSFLLPSLTERQRGQYIKAEV